MLMLFVCQVRRFKGDYILKRRRSVSETLKTASKSVQADHNTQPPPSVKDDGCGRAGEVSRAVYPVSVVRPRLARCSAEWKGE